MEVLHTWKVIIKKYLVTLANNFFSFNSCIDQVRNIHKEHSGAHCSTANIHCFFQLQHSKHCNLVLRRRQGSHLETPSYILYTGCYSVADVTDEKRHQPPSTLSQLSGRDPPPLLFSLSTSQKTEIDWEVLAATDTSDFTSDTPQEGCLF